jgi:hypothetical protein
MEKRRYERKVIDIPVTYVVKGGAGTHQGVGRDISIGGIFIETQSGAPFGAEVIIQVQLRTATGGMGSFSLPGIVRWVRSGGMGVQFKLLGAHETHAITELTRED